MIERKQLEAAIVENYEQWSAEVKLLRAALRPFAQINTRIVVDGLVQVLVKAKDVEHAKKAMSETDY